LLLARFGLSSAFLSAVADRFGAWGPPGAAGVAWGDFQHFVAYTGVLNPSAPAALVPVLAWVATVLEAGFGLALLIGLQIRTMALGSAVLLIAFAVAMAWGPGGLHAVFTHSVLSAAGAALLLAGFADRA
jgi:uncharacterized membrane protein YphA (DoxX/SURF4 family)